jgi:beta,beta-carotene 9',10'-dioxygenase
VDLSTTSTSTRNGQASAVTGAEANRSVGFRSLDQELTVDHLPVKGSLPDWLGGTLVRVTPALLDVGGQPIRHWFDGLAMLNAFSFRQGAVSYGNRFLRTEAYRRASAGRMDMIGFATDPCRALFKRVAALFSSNINDNANVNLTQWGNRYLAMTELPLPVEFDPRTLETLGLERYRDRLRGHVGTAHPHHDRNRDALVNYMLRFSLRSSYRIFALPSGSRHRRQIASIPVRHPAYMHSFGLSERYAILAEYPFVVDPLRLVLSGRPFIHNYRWEPERGTTFHVIELATGDVIGRFEAEPFFAFHHANAFERNGELMVDIVTYEDASSIDLLEIESLRQGGPPARFGQLRRYRLPLRGGSMPSSEPLADVGLDLPRINYGRRNGRDYRYLFAASARSSASDWFDQLAKVDVEAGEVKTWWEDGCYPGEGVFVPTPDARSEDDGVVLSVVLDAALERSFVLVLDAETFDELARAEVPHHIPFGFHGQYFDV